MSPRRVVKTQKRAVKRVKYSNETFSNAILMSAPASSGALKNDYYVPVITPSTTSGMRKAKNFTINVTCSPPLDPNTGQPVPIIISAILVYVPEGTNPMAPDFTQISPSGAYPSPATLSTVYKPDQNIIMFKVANITNSGNLTMRNRLARNLNSGDAVGVIVSVFRTAYDATADLAAIVSANYAVTY